MKNKLNPKLWSGDELKPDVKNKLLEIARHFYEYLNIDVYIQDIILTGSMASFNYKPESDIDIHLLIDFDEVEPFDAEMTKDFLMAKKELYNLKRNITVKGYKVELYPQNITQPHHSNGQYSILKGKWVKKPKTIKPPKIKDKVLSLSKIYKELIDDVVQLEDDKLKLDLANTIKKDIIQKRRDGLDTKGEQSIGNQLFKKLRRDDFYNLFDAISKTTDKTLSLEQRALK